MGRPDRFHTESLDEHSVSAHISCVKNRVVERTIEIDVLLELRDYLRANYWFLFRKFKLLIVLLL